MIISRLWMACLAAARWGAIALVTALVAAAAAPPALSWVFAPPPSWRRVGARMSIARCLLEVRMLFCLGDSGPTVPVQPSGGGCWRLGVVPVAAAESAVSANFLTTQ